MTYDIIIVGGGMVGAALACTLQNSAMRIALIDSTPPNFSDPRLIALNYSSCAFLKNLNLWERLLPYAAPIQEVHVSYAGKFGATRITANEMQFDFLGHVIPAKHINAVLYDALKKIDIFQPATLKNFSQNENCISLEIAKESEEKTLAGKLLIGADGTHSTVRRLLNIDTEIFDYQQSAIVTKTQLQRSHENVAYERFHKSGAIAMLPLCEEENHQVATIWSDSNEKISQLMQLSEKEFLQKLQQQFGYRLGKLKNIHKRFVFPLQMIRAKNPVRNRVVLIGNAAHTLHPIAAQGLNLALHEVAVIAEKLMQEKFNPDDLLKNSTQLQSSLRLSHHLPKLFSNDFFVTNTARQLGMIGLDVCLTAKRRFAKHAMGLAGNIPALIKD